MDEIPVKVIEKYKPPKKIALPGVLQHKPTSNALKLKVVKCFEYVFKLNLIILIVILFLILSFFLSKIIYHHFLIYDYFCFSMILIWKKMYSKKWQFGAK